MTYSFPCKMTARKKALNAMAAKSPLQSQTQQQRTA